MSAAQINFGDLPPSLTYGHTSLTWLGIGIPASGISVGTGEFQYRTRSPYSCTGLDSLIPVPELVLASVFVNPGNGVIRRRAVRRYGILKKLLPLQREINFRFYKTFYND
jgi:hypothetical protein